MHVFVVYAHPSEDSFCRFMRDCFLEGLKAAGHTTTLSDLYAMDFTTDMTPQEYDREAGYRLDLPVPNDVALEQAKINKSDALVFIYPVFWTDAPAKLKGWFDRVWTYGFAYGEHRTMKTLQKALVIANAGNPLETLEQNGFAESMRKVMLEDRIADRALHKQMILLESTSKETPALRSANWEPHLTTVREAALGLF